jgi:hypothetical protein
MQKSYGEGLATHAGPESCGGARKSTAEALTGVRAGQVFSRERNFLWGADAVRRSGRHNRLPRYRERQADPTRSQTLGTYGNTSRENREIPRLPAGAAVAGRVGKSIDVRRR